MVIGIDTHILIKSRGQLTVCVHGEAIIIDITNVHMLIFSWIAIHLYILSVRVFSSFAPTAKA